MAMFLCVPYLFASVSVRASYSLGLPFKYVEKETKESIETQYLERRSRFLGFKHLFWKTSIHLDIYGNCFWYVKRDKRGSIFDIQILQPERITIQLDKYGEVEKYLISYPNWLMRGYSAKVIELLPHEVLHFKINDISETPWGFSMLAPIITSVEARMEINKILPILAKAYAKPYRHFKFTPPQAMSPTDVQTTIDGMITALDQDIEPDSDIVTGDAWDISSISTQSLGGNIRDVMNDLDQQIYAVMGVPEYFFKPRGSTDLSINKSDQWFRDMMKIKTEYFEDRMMRQYVIPELDAMFSDTENLPELKFEDPGILIEERQQMLDLYEKNAIDLNELRLSYGLKLKPEMEKKEMEIKQEKPIPEDIGENSEIIHAFRTALDKDVELAEEYQNGEMSDSEFIRRLKVRVGDGDGCAKKGSERV